MADRSLTPQTLFIGCPVAKVGAGPPTAWMKERGNRDQIVVSSKLAFDYPGCNGGLTAAEIQRECEKSLKRLETDRIDLYYAHRDDLETPLEEIMEAFDRLVKAGKVRAIGAGNLSARGGASAKREQVHKPRNHWTEYSVVEQRYTYLRPRHGADFGPQIFISEELKDYARTRAAPDRLLNSQPGAYTRSDREVPMQFAGPDSDERLGVLQAVAGEAGYNCAGHHRLDAASDRRTSMLPAAESSSCARRSRPSTSC